MCHEASESAGDQSGKFLLTPYSDAAPSGIDDQVRCPSASILFSSLGWYRFQIVVPFAPASRTPFLLRLRSGWEQLRTNGRPPLRRTRRPSIPNGAP